MADKKKKTIFSPTKESVSTPSSPRKHVIVLSERDPTNEDTKETIESEKSPTILLKTREQSTSKDERPISPKKEELDFPQPSKIAYNEFKEKKIEQRPAPALKTMKEPVKLMDENLEIVSPAIEFLSEANTQFLVIGVIGTQGVGKSMVLNLLSQTKKVDFCEITPRYTNPDEIAELEHHVSELSVTNGVDKPDHAWINFKMQNMEHLELNEHCTKGIDMYVTKDRIIYLDCQAMWSPSLEEAAAGRSGNPVIAGLQLASFVMSVCHVVIAVQDWILDYNFVRYIQTAEMLKPTLTMPTAPPATASTSAGAGAGAVGSPGAEEGDEDAEESSEETNPHLLLIHNRCSFEDFLPRNVRALHDLYRPAFEHSSLQLQSGMYVVEATEGPEALERAGAPVNLFLLPEIKDETDKTIYHGHLPFEQLVARLRRQVLAASRHRLTNVACMTERAWYHFCHRAWETIRASSFFIEYERLLP